MIDYFCALEIDWLYSIIFSSQEVLFSMTNVQYFYTESEINFNATATKHNVSTAQMDKFKELLFELQSLLPNSMIMCSSFGFICQLNF